MSDNEDRKRREVKYENELEDNDRFSYKGLCISSGGYKGFGILGALAILDLEGYFEETYMYSGCSVGSILTLLLAVGWKPIELFRKAIKVKVFNGFQDIDIEQFKDELGIMSNEPLTHELESLMLEKRDDIPTLLELHEEGKYVSFSVFDRLTKRGYKIDYRSHPNVLSTDAAMWSANIPFVFPAVDVDGMSLLDGAFTNPFPIDYIDKGERVLGIVVYGQSGDDGKSPISYAIGCLMATIEELQRRSISAVSKNCHILELFVSDHDVLDPSDAYEGKTDMFFNGLHDGKIFIKALRKSKRKRKRKLPKAKIRTNIKTFPDGLITKCLISQPLDVLCQAASVNSTVITRNIKNLSERRLVRLKMLARYIIKDELNHGHYIDPSRIGKSKKGIKKPNIIGVSENYSQRIYDSLPLHLRSLTRVMVDSLEPEDANNTIDGINVIFEGLSRLGLNILDTPLIEQPRVVEVDDDNNDEGSQNKNSHRIEEID